MSLGLNNSQKITFTQGFFAYVVNFILLILSMSTINFVAFDNIHVVFFIAPLFYWTIFNPCVIPLWFIFISGLMIDIALDSLIGLHAFLFIVYYLILHRVRRIIMSQPTLYHFVIFMMSVTFFEIIRWVLLSLLMWQFSGITASLLSIILNIVAFFPILLVLKAVDRVVSNNGRR